MSKIQYHELLEVIETQIKNEEWKYGSRLPTMSELAAKHQVANSTIREVYRALESKGYVAIQQGRGTIVTFDRSMEFTTMNHSSFMELLKITEFRTIIEPSFAALAAREAFKNEIDLITESAEIMRVMAEKNQVTTSEDLRFHRLIVEATHNEYALRVYDNLQEELNRMRAYTKKPGMRERAVHYHQMIANAIANRDSQNAKMLMEAHLQPNSEIAMYELTEKAFK
ncbi:FCD domain-containing protein [Planomicrobium sp. Y74]|uniref:FadR/GntR family transcriptional regulator n=1 Tax=Planomicrobium sp. Y74 TaxID=2478977 RepID=UPI000EF550CA|nr:FCD domain-containing protein [Planomicrobium sp. Y74]RLQ90175.1 FadR family transcriptional regulator [Planomicrobium sp. Y74]